ncbi:hypothetical protein [Bacillus badius]|uniref:hypothetical protein n=1 Tax=Bacillus badius TaxID=1455 RepID=UPI000A4B3E62|nr:hypothetical protein [Bacillus badius]MED4717381.1 hypothetical protein [Bacillus badius]
MSKRKTLLTVVILAAVLVSIISYRVKYPIKNNHDDIQEYLIKWENQISDRSSF